MDDTNESPPQAPASALGRPFRFGVVDGDDVWPVLSHEHLGEIAALDSEAAHQEQLGPRPMSRRLAKEVGGAVYSIAERVRHVRHLVVLMEQGGVPLPGEYLTELGCRSSVERSVARLSESLQVCLQAELLGPLDERFRSVTVDDGGTLLRTNARADLGVESWWVRRPIRIDQTWERGGDIDTGPT